MKGTVKFMDTKKGWGFITSEDDREVFFHQSNILMKGFRKLDQGDRVEFEVVTDQCNKSKAINVKKIVEE